MNKKKTYYNPVEVIFKKGGIEKIGMYAKKYSKNHKVLLITAPPLIKQGIVKKLQNLLLKNNYSVEVFAKIDTYPSLHLLEEIVKEMRKKEFGIIIGIGGGSVMDCAKCVAILSRTDGHLLEYIKKRRKFYNDATPLIQIPTTAGTGSEVTKWATVWDFQKKKKYSLSDNKMYAKAAIIDPELMLGMPPNLTAITGMDALSHAIEAYWSKNHNPISDKYAIEAIRLINENLEKAYSKGKDIKSRALIALGSLKAGLAFSNTKTTAAHAISYPLTSYFRVPHGLACALPLGQLLKYNSTQGKDHSSDTLKRVNSICEALGCESPEQASKRLTALMKKLHLPTKLSELKITEKDFPIIIRNALGAERMGNNPRTIDASELRRLLKLIL